MRAQGSSPQFAIKYFDGDQNVTAQVTGDGYLTAQLAPGERAQLRVQIRARSTAPSNTHVTATIKVRSTALTTARDVVKVTAQR